MYSSISYIVAAFVILAACSQNVATEDDGLCHDLDTCCIDEPNGKSLGDLVDCTIFIVCLLDTAYPNECGNPDKPYYNVVKKACDGIENVTECSGGTRPPPINPPTPSPVPTDAPIITTMPPPTQQPPATTESGNTNCTRDGVYFIAYPGNCSLYMICSDFVLLPEPQQCAPGTLFDSLIGQCNLENLVQCPPVCPDSGTVNIADPRNCSRYWLCINGSPSAQECAPELVFDYVLGQCNLADLVLCPNFCPATGTKNLPHSTNCTRWWLCINGTPNLQNCAPGLNFDPILGQCSVIECSVGNGTTFQCPSLNGIQNGSDAPLKYQNPSDCNQFYICKNEEIVELQSCPENTWFYEEAGICEEPNEGKIC